MPPSKCPVCDSIRFRKLEGPSEDASVNYYRCGHCGHVWTTKKGHSDKLVTHVTDVPTLKPEPDRTDS